MRFQVPQFTEVEDKIFGPLTLKQFIYLIGGGGISFLFYVIFPLWLTVIFAAPVVIFVLALAFYKINNQPFIKIVENAIRFRSSSRLFLWKKSAPKDFAVKFKGPSVKSPQGAIYAPKLTNSKLKDLAWSLDIKK